jgi:hypothetical protein
MLYLVDMLILDPNILRDSILVPYSLPLACTLPIPLPATSPSPSTCTTVVSFIMVGVAGTCHTVVSMFSWLVHSPKSPVDVPTMRGYLR